MKNPALDSELYATARKALQRSKTFVLANEYGERKEFAPGTPAYTLASLKAYICIAHDLGETLTIEFTKEDNTMNTTFTTNTSNTIYEANETMTYCWKFPFGEKGKRVRISKGEFLEAQRIHEQEQEEALQRVIEEAEEERTTEELKEIQKEMAPKAKKTRKSKDAFHTSIAVPGLTLTAKQTSFLLHLSDTNFWENGLDSCIWVDILCDEIGGEFAGKPMTVGAMISTLCEKGLGTRATERREGRKCTSFALTETGKLVAAEVGLQ